MMHIVPGNTGMNLVSAPYYTGNLLSGSIDSNQKVGVGSGNRFIHLLYPKY
jgi:hypothetical protein